MPIVLQAIVHRREDRRFQRFVCVIRELVRELVRDSMAGPVILASSLLIRVPVGLDSLL